MVKIVCKRGDNIYTLSVSTEMIEDFGVVEVYGIRIMGKCQTAEVDDISADYHYVRRLFDLIVEEELYPEHLLDVVEDYLSGAFPKIIPFGLAMEQSCIA